MRPACGRLLEWSADGTRIYFTSDRVDEPYYAPDDSNLYAVSAGASSDGPLETVIDIAGPVRSARLSPDGKTWAFVGSINPKEVQSHTRSDLFVLRGGKPSPLTAGKDFEIGSSVGGDQHTPRGESPGGIAWNPVLTRSNLAGLFQAPKRSLAARLTSAASKSPTTASSALDAP